MGEEGVGTGGGGEDGQKSWVPEREGVVSSQVGGRGREVMPVWYR